MAHHRDVRSSTTTATAASPVTIMKTYVALLRAVNVGGTGKLPMSTLKQMCEEVGLKQVRTYIASGNVVLRAIQKRQKSSQRLRADCKHMLESRSACWSDRLARWPLFWLAIRFQASPAIAL
jgi:hypothetical protein